jgi:rRNA-processing protein FCF1
MELIILILAVAIFANTTFLMVMKVRQRTMKLTRGSLLLDTSAIMDGRIVDVMKTGIISQEIIIPRSVLNEMQLLADKADSEKRQRARHGLELVREIRAIDQVSVSILQDGRVDRGGVDERLIELSRKTGASIATVDYNLNKLAKALDITVVNVNELAQVLRAKKMPGEQIEIEILQNGSNREQAIGYLDDGTMVVVEDAKNLIGQRVKVEIQRSLQTEAGRMIFAKRVGAKNEKNSRKVEDKVREKVVQSKSFHSENIKKDAAKSAKNSHRGGRKVQAARAKKAENFAKNLENNSQNVEQKHEKDFTKNAQNSATISRKPRRKTQKSAENSLVALANKLGKDN